MWPPKGKEMSDSKWIRTVQALLDLAGHPNTPEAERANALQKADAIMFERRIDEAMLNQARPKTERKDIVQRSFGLDTHYEFMGDQVSFMGAVFGHFGNKVYRNWDGVVTVGFEHNLDMAEMMWMTINRDYVAKLFPSWDKSLTVQENVFNIKSSGKSWMDIVHMAPEDAGLTKNSGSTLRSMYKREAEKRGITHVEHSRTPAKYRVSFSESFSSRICQRLRDMEREAKSDLKDRDESKSVALIADEDLVAEKFYEMFPNLKPMSDEDRAAFKARLQKEWDEEERLEAERRAKLTDKQREAEDAKNARQAERDRRRWARESARNRPDMLGWSQGKSAADSVQLSQTESFKMKDQING